MKFLSIIFLIIFWSLNLLSQPERLNSGSTLNHQSSSQGTWKVRTYFDYPDYRFLIATGVGRGSVSASSQRLQFNPANHPELGITITKGLFFLGYRTALPIKSPTYADYDIGKTDVKDFKLGFEWKGIEVGSYYTRFKGFFVDLNATQGMSVTKDGSSTTIVSSGGTLSHTPDIWRRPDVRTNTYGLYSQYKIPILGKNSFFSGTPEIDLINKIWEVDLVLKGGYHRMAIEGNIPFVPESRASVFPEIASLTGVYQHAFYGQIGMLNQFNFTRKWNFSVDIVGGGEFMNHSSRYLDRSDESDWATGERIEMLVGAGYGGENHLWNLSYQSFFRVMDAEGSSSLDTHYSRFGLSYAFIF